MSFSLIDARAEDRLRLRAPPPFSVLFVPSSPGRNSFPVPVPDRPLSWSYVPTPERGVWMGVWVYTWVRKTRTDYQNGFIYSFGVAKRERG